MLGYSQYSVTGGDMKIDGVSLLNLSITERSKKGIFLALQNIPEIPGLKLSEFLRTIYNEHLKNVNPSVKPLTPFVFGRFILPFLKKLDIPADFLARDLNVGFS
jgi:Fe-S cluster assembly ATP-binding protein